MIKILFDCLHKHGEYGRKEDTLFFLLDGLYLDSVLWEKLVLVNITQVFMCKYLWLAIRHSTPIRNTKTL